MSNFTKIDIALLAGIFILLIVNIFYFYFGIVYNVSWLQISTALIFLSLFATLIFWRISGKESVQSFAIVMLCVYFVWTSGLVLFLSEFSGL